MKNSYFKGSAGVIAAVVIIIIVIAVGAYMVGNRQAEAPVVPEDATNVDRSNNTDEPALVSSVKVPLFQDGGNVVCGVKVVYVEQDINPTLAPLNATYKALFALPEPYTAAGVEYQNPIGYQVKKTDFPKLTFDRAEIKDGVASVYLRGSLTGVGTCYDPLPKIQLDEVAKQFSSVTSVKYYLNNKPFDPGAIADQR